MYNIHNIYICTIHIYIVYGKFEKSWVVKTIVANYRSLKNAFKDLGWVDESPVRISSGGNCLNAHQHLQNMASPRNEQNLKARGRIIIKINLSIADTLIYQIQF